MNSPPEVALLAPTNNTTVEVGAAVTLVAAARDHDGSVTNVAFFAGSTLLTNTTTSPYVAIWTAATACSTSTFTAVAFDNVGATTTSMPVQVAVIAPPTVTLDMSSRRTCCSSWATRFSSRQPRVAPAASESAKWTFTWAGNPFATDDHAPYQYTWRYAAPGTYTVSAKATDNDGGTASSSTNTFRVNAPPVVALTSPPQGLIVDSRSNFDAYRHRFDSDGTIASLAFYNGTNLLVSTTPGTSSVTVNVTTNFIQPGLYPFAAVKRRGQQRGGHHVRRCRGAD